MKNLFVSLPLFLLGALLMTACGGNQNLSCPAGQISTPQGCQANQQVYQNGYQTGYNQNNNCPANQVNTQMGCLGQGGPCTQGMGWDPKYNRCYPAMGGNAGYNNQYNGGYNTTGWGGNIGLPPNGGNNQCANGYAPTQQGCIPRCSFNYNNGMCVNY